MSAASESLFYEQLAPKMEIVDEGVAQFISGLRQEVAEENVHAKTAVEACLSLLERGGKRWRGVLTVTGYELYEGQNEDVITKASGAIEGMHAYLLVLDDCADDDKVRRGGPAAHATVRTYLEQQEAWGDIVAGSMHMAITAGTVMQYWALPIIHGLEVPARQNRLAKDIVYKELRATGLGQLLDLAGSHVPLEKPDIVAAARYKTARYSFLLPLQLGAVLAGAPAEHLSDFEPYAHNVGLAYQMRDDIVGLFGDVSYTGKSAGRDIIMNKQTLLIRAALEMANGAQHRALVSALGNMALQHDQLQNCLDIIRDTGALSKTEKTIDQLTQGALESLDNAPLHWPAQQVNFLRMLAMYGARRQK